MRNVARKAIPIIIAAPLLLGCATKGDLEALRSDLTDMIRAAQQDAAAAKADSQASAAAAEAAAEKADRVLRESLRK